MNWEDEFAAKMMQGAGERPEEVAKENKQAWSISPGCLREFAGIIQENPEDAEVEKILRQYLAIAAERQFNAEGLKRKWKVYEGKELIFLVQNEDSPKIVSVLRSRDALKIKKTMQRIEELQGFGPENKFPIDMEKVQFTDHCLRQFIERFPELQNIESTPGMSARTLLKGAVEDRKIEQRFKIERAIANKFKPARYFINGACRFVLAEQQDGTFSVLTIEKPKESRDNLE